MHVIPNDQTSTFPSYWPSSIARITSGAIQYGVPTKLLAGHLILAEPKSARTGKSSIRVYERERKEHNSIFSFNIGQFYFRVLQEKYQ